MDIAVVFLPATKFNFSSTVQKICMINPSLYMPTIASYSQAWIAGFGALTDAQGLMMFTKDGRMRDAQLLIFHEDICHELKTFKEFDSYTNICAGEADAVDRLKDSKYHVCIADTGGPLMIKVSLDSHGASTETIERMALLGVVSKPHGCQADRLLPGVYVNVPLQFDWLRMWFDRPRRQPGAFEYGKTVLTDARGFEHPVTVAKYRWYPYPMDIPFAREEDGGIDGVCPCTFESIRPFKSTLPPCLFPGEGCSNNAGADICCKGMCKLPNLIKTALQPGAMPQWPYYQIIKGNYGVCPF